MKIAVFGQFYKEKSKEYILELFSILEEKNIEFAIENKFYNLLKEKIKIPLDYTVYSNFKDLNTSFDAMLTIGGDGTILRAITLIRDSNIPILGINTGRLGFLATIQKEEIKLAIESLLLHKYSIKERSVLQVKTVPEIDFNKLDFALNEIAINRNNSTSMIIIKTYLDDEYLTSYWADGLIISTPTGSTGYSLSCGGPVITPYAKNLIVSPIAPHNLNARPLVIPDETKIKLKVSGRENQFLISLDSRVTTINKKTEIYIEKAPFTIKMIELQHRTFLKTLREKLLWGADKRN